MRGQANPEAEVRKIRRRTHRRFLRINTEKYSCENARHVLNRLTIYSNLSSVGILERRPASGILPVSNAATVRPPSSKTGEISLLSR